MTDPSYGASDHYDRVTAAWSFLLGEDLHYGLFEATDDDLPIATGRLTRMMIDEAALAPGLELLDVGCGTGAPACLLAAEHRVRVTGITTSEEGIVAARRRAADEGVGDSTEFLGRDGMANGFPDQSFDRVWALESSHLMRRREQLIGECARVLRPGGRFVLCDIVLRRPIEFAEVRRRREEFGLLRAVFGDSRMELLATYREHFVAAGLEVGKEIDLTETTRPTFEHWRQNANRHRREVVAALGETDWRRFVDSCDVLESFWDEGVLGYGLISGSQP